MFPKVYGVLLLMGVVTLHPVLAKAKRCALCNRQITLVAENWGIFFQFNSSKPESPAEPYGGVMMKALKYMQEDSNFTYVIKRSPDRGWGSPDRNGTWNGMVKTIMDEETVGKIDFSIGMFNLRALDLEFKWRVNQDFIIYSPLFCDIFTLCSHRFFLLILCG